MIVLFDIDGTLTTGSDCGRRSLERALRDVLGSEDPLRGAVLHGNIDWVLVRDAAQAAGRWPDARTERRALVSTVLERYRTYFAQAVGALPYRALPSATECVLAARARCALVGLATGNEEQCARGKLASAGIGHLFADCIGGYGDEAESRAEVVTLATQRAMRVAPGARGVLVVGDTPHDVAAGHAAGARVAAVATGRFTAESLREAGADWTFPTLAELIADPPWA